MDYIDVFHFLFLMEAERRDVNTTLYHYKLVIVRQAKNEQKLICLMWSQPVRHVFSRGLQLHKLPLLHSDLITAGSLLGGVSFLPLSTYAPP